MLKSCDSDKALLNKNSLINKLYPRDIMEWIRQCPTNARFVNAVSVVRPFVCSHLAWQFACVLFKLYRMHTTRNWITCIMISSVNRVESMPMVLLWCNMDSKFRRVLPQMMGKVLLFCLSMQFFKTLDRYRQLLRLGMFLFFLVHLLCNCLSNGRKTSDALWVSLLNYRDDKDDIFFKTEIA